ncbi:MAG: metallophosphoesterase [Niastella sp.]|nr:metallophosphoesterase [Niastella sp.]
MTIQYCSDLHLELPENVKWLKANPLVPAAEILVLAGDIIPFTEMDTCVDFFSFLGDHFKTTYWLPGNHEYYTEDITHRSGSFREAIRSNVFLLNNQVEQIEDATLIFSTLWSHISPAAEWDIARAVTDYRSILQGDERFRPLHSNRLHREYRQFIEHAVAEATTANIVVATHHVPTFMHYPKQYKGSVINEAFATELYGYIEQSPITAWIYGHHHSNSPEFLIGNTRMLTNQLGYVRRREYYGFRKDAVIDL